MTSFLREVCSAGVYFCRRSGFMWKTKQEGERKRSPGDFTCEQNTCSGSVCVWDRRGKGTGCVGGGVSHLALPQNPLPSPPHPPGHRFSAGSAGGTHQTPDPPSARSSWPETVREHTGTTYVGFVRAGVGRKQQQEHSEGGGGETRYQRRRKEDEQSECVCSFTQVTRNRMKNRQNRSRKKNGNVWAEWEVKNEDIGKQQGG